MAGSIVVFNRSSGRYETIRQDIYDGTIGVPYSDKVYVDGRRYRSERGYNDAQQREYEKGLDSIRAVENAGDLDGATVVVNWTKGDMGYQARADIDYRFTDPNGVPGSGYVTGKRTRGYGYDKESTAIADAMEMVPEIRKVSYGLIEDEKPYEAVTRRKGDTPYFKGGAGTGVIFRDLRGNGYEVDHVSYGEGNAPDIYTIRRTRVSNRARKASGVKRSGRFSRILGRSG